MSDISFEMIRIYFRAKICHFRLAILFDGVLHPSSVVLHIDVFQCCQVGQTLCKRNNSHVPIVGIYYLTLLYEGFIKKRTARQLIHR